jgi:hypothetical protein
MAETDQQHAEETLAWERDNRARAGVAAIAAGLLTLVGGVLSSITNRDSPSVYALDALRDAAGQPVPGGGLKTEQVLFVDAHAGALLASAVLLALGAALMAPVLGFLFRATRARNPALSAWILYPAVIAPVLIGVSQAVLYTAVVLKAGDFADGTARDTATAHDALQGGVITAAQVLSQLSLLFVALAFVLVCLNAMRAGLLTRFMGVLGIIVGALFVLGGQLNQTLPIVQVFWLVAVGNLIVGRWPSPVPAWETGKAEPWPTQQQLREERERAERGDMTGPATVPDVAAKAQHPSSKKKKRKR